MSEGLSLYFRLALHDCKLQALLGSARFLAPFAARSEEKGGGQQSRRGLGMKSNRPAAAASGQIGINPASCWQVDAPSRSSSITEKSPSRNELIPLTPRDGAHPDRADAPAGDCSSLSNRALPAKSSRMQQE